MASETPPNDAVPCIDISEPPSESSSNLDVPPQQQLDDQGLTEKQFQEVLDSVLKESPVVGRLIEIRAQALTEILHHRMTIKEAAATYGITNVTLQKYLKKFQEKLGYYNDGPSDVIPTAAVEKAATEKKPREKKPYERKNQPRLKPLKDMGIAQEWKDSNRNVIIAIVSKVVSAYNMVNMTRKNKLFKAVLDTFLEMPPLSIKAAADSSKIGYTTIRHNVGLAHEMIYCYINGDEAIRSEVLQRNENKEEFILDVKAPNAENVRMVSLPQPWIIGESIIENDDQESRLMDELFHLLTPEPSEENVSIKAE